MRCRCWAMPPCAFSVKTCSPARIPRRLSRSALTGSCCPRQPGKSSPTLRSFSTTARATPACRRWPTGRRGWTENFSPWPPRTRRALSEGEWQRQRPPDDEVFAFHYDWTTGQPRVETPGFLHALSLLQRLQKFRVPPGQPPGKFSAGRAVLCIASPAWIGRFQEAGSPVAGKFAFCRVPGSGQFFDYRTGKATPVPGNQFVPYLGASGWLGVVSQSAGHPEAAFDLLAHLSDPETSRKVVVEPAWGGGAFRGRISSGASPGSRSAWPRHPRTSC